MSIKLSQYRKRVPEKLTRTFWFFPEGAQGEGFTFTASYLSPALFQETGEKSKAKVIGGRRSDTSDVGFLKRFREVTARELLLKAIDKVEGCTFGHLRSLIPDLDPGLIANAGGIDAIIPMDPDAISEADQKAIAEGTTTQKEAQARAKALAEENILELLLNAPEFFDFVMKAVSGLENFQDEEWEEQIANLKSVG